VTVASVEPQDTAAHVAYRPGTRWAAARPGRALLMPQPSSPADGAALPEARRSATAAGLVPAPTPAGDHLPSVAPAASPASANPPAVS
jgi:hypothetical protein